MYDAVQAGIDDYDREILRKLAEMEREECREQQASKLKNEGKARAIKNRGEEPLRQALYRMSGVDATVIDAIGVGTVEVILSEYGPDLSPCGSKSTRARAYAKGLPSLNLPSLKGRQSQTSSFGFIPVYPVHQAKPG